MKNNILQYYPELIDTTANTEITTISDYVDIPFPLLREITYTDKIISITVDYKKLKEQMECWNYNRKNGYA